MLCQLSYSHRDVLIIATGVSLCQSSDGKQNDVVGYNSRWESKLDAANADVFKPQRAQAGRIEQVLRVNDDRVL